MKKSVIGIVETQIQAERIVDQLQQRGVASSDISVLFPDKRGSKDFAHEHNTKAPRGRGRRALAPVASSAARLACSPGSALWPFPASAR